MKVLSIQELDEVQGGGAGVVIVAITAVAAVAMSAMATYTCNNGGSASFSWGGFGGSCTSNN